jgi:hypothetical protein
MTATATEPSANRIPAHLLAVAGLLAEVGAIVVAAALASRTALPPLDGNALGGYALGATFPIVGWVLASRRPGNAIGWIFLGIGLSQALAQLAQVYTLAAYGPGASPLPLAPELSWLSVIAWMPGYVLLLTLSILLFPDGRPPSPRWRPVAWVAWAALALMVVPMALATWPLRGPQLAAAAGASGPPAIASLRIAVTLETVGLVVASATALLSVIGLVLRFRRSRGLERQQLKWFTFAGAIEILLIGSSQFLNVGQAGSLTVLVTLLVAPLLPVAAGIAILRHRLLDIDLVIKRTVSYGALTILLVGLEVGGILVLQQALTAIAGEQTQTLAVAVTTLGVAALFQPARRRIQAWVDRRFYRARYDAEQVLAAFASRLRDEISLGRLTDDLSGSVTAALQPASVSIWVREREGGR